ncbi:cytochrome P450 [Mycena epipterygia]|nr:cytochrome P450 [Mycena epipterygia]
METLSPFTMPSTDLSPMLGAIIAGLAIILYCLHSAFSTRNLPLPPGPRKLPIVGNIFDLPPGSEWKTYKNWSRQYNSDIIHLNFAGTSVIVLSSLEAAEELLERRSSIYSDRPASPMLNDLMGRTSRRLFYQGFNAISAQNFHPKELAATHRLLRLFLHTPDAFRDHIRQMAGEVIISVAYGINVLPVNDPYIAAAEEGLQTVFQAAIPGRFLGDSIPMLKYVPDWFPGAGFKLLAKEWRKLTRALTDLPFEEAKRQISLQILSETSDKYYQEETVKVMAASMYTAGADTTVAVLITFVLAMLFNPEAQKQAQLEIDTVIGPGQLPHFNDEQSLLYLSALVKEVLRWGPVAPMGVPHLLTAEDQYRGYRLPAGSVDMYPDPKSFNPERFLRDGKLNPDVRDPQAAFGFGRRICPGRHMAMSSVWITIASILAVFDIAVVDDGQIIELSYEFSPDLTSAPLPFKCSIKPRFPDAVELIEATVNGD